MDANQPAVAVAEQTLVVAPGFPSSLPAAWPTPQDARRAAVIVAGLVGVPAFVAAAAAAALFALTAAVLLAPLVAAVLTWAAWHCNRVPRKR